MLLCHIVGRLRAQTNVGNCQSISESRRCCIRVPISSLKSQARSQRTCAGAAHVEFVIKSLVNIFPYHMKSSGSGEYGRLLLVYPL